MTRIRRYAPLLAAVLLLAACGDESSEVISLADRLTDGMDFDAGRKKPGVPEGHAGTGYPQITELDAPARLAPGQAFQITACTDYAQLEAITGAVVRVLGSDAHIWVDGLADPIERQVLLLGQLGADPELGGHTYTVQLALQESDEKTGDYVDWVLEVVANQ